MNNRVKPFTGCYFFAEGKKSAWIKCGDVADRFPCAYCRAGLDGNNLRCRDDLQSEIDVKSYRRWRATIDALATLTGASHDAG